MEPLEPRIAPAAVFTYTDVDGDLVTVETSKGTDEQLAAILTFSADASQKRKLELVDFSANPFVFRGTNLTITAETAGGGDGLANVGRIGGVSTSENPFIDLGNLVIDGDLGEIDAGDANRKTPGIKSLTVTSIGAETPDTFTANGISEIFGGAGKVVITGDVDEDARLRFDQIGSLQLEGTLFGRVTVATKLGSAAIGTINGELASSAFFIVGTPLPAAIGSIQIGSIIPNAAAAGTVSLAGKVKSLSVDSIVAELSVGSGVVIEGPVKSLTFGKLSRGSQDLALPVGVIGNVASLSVLDPASDAGVLIEGNVGKATLAGLTGPALITISKNLGSLKVSGNLAGTAMAQLVVQTGGNIGSIDIAGDVSFTLIQAGTAFNNGGPIFSPDARIGAVHVGGNWTASTLAAGVQNLASLFPGPDKLTIVSAIKSIVIDGAVAGTGGVQEFGFAAQQIGSMKVGDTVIPFVKGPANDLERRLIAGTNNVFVVEVGYSWPNLTPA